MKKEIQYPCDNCGKQAVYNLQNIWKLWSIKNDDDFEENDEWEGDENSFYCEKCYEEEMNNH